ncbi:DUF488 domain-containing protein [Youngiibacter fragilis]|uniref:DUF488 domain-containing protein n=1 Tax=Youngiibacter fragilis 232.1 TaxID=994573 RepID=V7I9K5_9CLOT|nr:DUF488 domain-containing protein [Youngiibacter fragilis]ETA82004.1 hypothetical protein T472_0203325 [Youngiibacter fragilis 232.1]
MRIFTIGSNRKSAETFFELLRNHDVRFLLDIRLRNTSQLAGFAKGDDLRYFTEELLGIGYRHDVRFAPDEGLFEDRKAKKLSMEQFGLKFRETLGERDMKQVLIDEYAGMMDGICLLCSEEDHRECHRSVVADYIAEIFEGSEVVNL